MNGQKKGEMQQEFMIDYTRIERFDFMPIRKRLEQDMSTIFMSLKLRIETNLKNIYHLTVFKPLLTIPRPCPSIKHMII